MYYEPHIPTVHSQKAKEAQIENKITAKNVLFLTVYGWTITSYWVTRILYSLQQLISNTANG